MLGVRCEQLWLRAEREISLAVCSWRSKYRFLGSGKENSQNVDFIISNLVGDWSVQITQTEFEWCQIQKNIRQEIKIDNYVRINKIIFIISGTSIGFKNIASKIANELQL